MWWHAPASQYILWHSGTWKHLQVESDIMWIGSRHFTWSGVFIHCSPQKVPALLQHVHTQGLAHSWAHGHLQSHLTSPPYQYTTVRTLPWPVSCFWKYKIRQEFVQGKVRLVPQINCWISSTTPSRLARLPPSVSSCRVGLENKANHKLISSVTGVSHSQNFLHWGYIA